jgi:hypothetical protein
MCSSQSPSDRLTASLAAMAAVPAAERGASADRIRALVSARASVEALLVDEVAVFDAAGAAVDDGAPTTASWLRAQARFGQREASGLVHRARELRQLRSTRDAALAGAISQAHVSEIVKARLRSCLGGDDFGPYEQILVNLALEASPDEVRAAVAHLVEAEQPDRDKALVDALADRSFSLRPVGDLVKVDALVDRVTAEALGKGVDALSRSSLDDHRTWQVRRADAFSEIVMLGLESGSLPQQGRVKPHVTVAMTLDQLRGIDGTAALLDRFGQIPASSAQRLACDAVLTRLVTDPHGEVLDVGRSCRHTNTALTKALHATYATCAYPNCDTPTARCDIHHVWWWSHGGPTDQWNLVPLCKHHHLFVHEYGYFIQTGVNPDGRAARGPTRWRFAAPSGRLIPDHRTTLSAHNDQLAALLDALPLPGVGSLPGPGSPLGRGSPLDLGSPLGAGSPSGLGSRPGLGSPPGRSAHDDSA